MAVRTLRAEPVRVLLPALVVFALDAWAATGFTELSADHLGLESVAAAAVLAFSTLGLTFYSGLLERLVGAVEQGHDPPPVGQVLRSLPYGRLLVADGIVWVATSVGSVALVVPGLVVSTLCVLVGPIITTEGGSIPQAFRTSVRLMVPHFLLALCLITFPLGVENEVVTAVRLAVGHENVGLVFASHLALGLTFGVLLGLVEVSLAEALLHGAQGPAKHVRSAQPAPPAEPVGPSPGNSEGGHHGRDHSRDGDAGTGDHPPAG
jgi:hypothetical protein